MITVVSRGCQNSIFFSHWTIYTFYTNLSVTGQWETTMYIVHFGIMFINLDIFFFFKNKFSITTNINYVSSGCKCIHVDPFLVTKRAFLGTKVAWLCQNKLLT